MVTPDGPRPDIKEPRIEAKLAEIVNLVDGRLTTLFNEQKGFDRREHLCGPAAFMFKRKAQKEGIETDVWQNSDLHQTIGGTIEAKLKAFQHAIAIARLGDKHYLVDTAICQFIKPDGTISVNQAGIAIEDNNTHIQKEPVIQELYERGFIDLTDEKLRAFLRATTTDTTPAYVDMVNQVTVDDLFKRTKPRRPDYTDEKLDGMLGD